ncbi:MAG: Nre family DNA repair protein [Candidatus Nanohaloarchaea archaeon]|nr:Nre family DNA repair protein [Candidatus Nanohaloarchaea archaeon]
MDEDTFDDRELSSERLARMDPRQRRQWLENRVYQKYDEFSPTKDSLDDSFFGASPPSIFVGRHGYPKVNAGILSPVEHRDSAVFDSPDTWYGDNAAIEEVIGYRSNLVNSRSTAKVTEVDTFQDEAKEIAMASTPVDVEVELAKTPDFELNFQERSQPFGPAEQVEEVDITENPSVARAVEKAVSDDDWKAEGAARYLYRKDLDTYQIQRVLSAGLLGEQDNRRLVPTRWSITATDDTLGKGLRRDVKQYQELGEMRLFTNEYNGNFFNVLLIPGQWEYELVEIKGAGSVWNPGDDAYLAANHETYDGRTQYAAETAGAYYAARLGVLEYLHDIQRQAKALIVRDVTDKYWAPLGVWVIRETVRNAFDEEYSIPQNFSQAVQTIDGNISVDLDRVRQKSEMMEGTQQSVKDFF